MNRKWRDKTTLEKTFDIISGIALCVCFLFEMMGRNNPGQLTDLVSYIAIFVVCVCEAFSFWKIKRVFSYVAIAGALLLAGVVILEMFFTRTPSL